MARRASGRLDNVRLLLAPAVPVKALRASKVSLELKVSVRHSGRAKARDNISNDPADRKGSALRQVALRVPEAHLVLVGRPRVSRSVRVAGPAALDKHP